MAIDILRLPPHRWEDYRDLRLEALRTEPEAFGASFEDYSRKPEEYWRGRLEDASGWLLFAQSEGMLVGMIGAYRPEGQDEIELISMYVAPAQRGQGIARQLMAAILDALRDAGTTGRVRLAVNEDQTAAMALYLRSGFMPDEVKEARMGDGQMHRELFMSREL